MTPKATSVAARRLASLAAFVLIAALISACAGLQPRDPLQVTVADIESLPGEGLEIRMMVKLRVQNPNDAPMEYDGVYVQLDVLEKTFATGVSDEHGTIRPFSEAVMGVPVTVSALRMALFGIGMLDGRPIDRINYKLHGKLSGPGFGSTSFQSQGDFALSVPASPRSPRSP